MKVLFYFVGVLIYAAISTIIKSAGYILGGIPTAVLFFCTVYLIPRILIKCRDRRITKKKIKKLSATLKISEDIPAHCENVESNDRLADYLQTCVTKGLLTEEQSSVLFDAYKE